jgi:hypothetical protein
LPGLVSTAAACAANLSCVMFTSDGYLIGAYRSPADADSMLAAIDQEQQGSGPLEWVPMDYCSGKCCGTWVADGLVQQLLTPVNSSSSSIGSSSSSGLQRVGEEELPTDSHPGLSVLMDERGLQALCDNRTANATDGQAQPLLCPRRCAVACCARYAQGVRALDRQLFQQCSAGVCGPEQCMPLAGVPGVRARPLVLLASLADRLAAAAAALKAKLAAQDGPVTNGGARASPDVDVLRLQYLRAVSRNSPQQQQIDMNASRPLGSTLQ